jgi:gamma-glutamyltranspeptidase / glutathione hydrolase
MKSALLSDRRSSASGLGLLLIGSLLAAACASPAPLARPVDAAPGGSSSVGALSAGPTHVSRSARGMVVSGKPLATRAGVEMLELGGNAVDAAVATAFALTVVEPSMSSLGGRTQMLIRTPAGEFVGIDGTTQVAAGYDPARGPDGTSGYGTIAIPGTVAALAAAVQAHGSLSLAQVLAPAIRLAAEGFSLTPLEASRLAASAELLAESPGARAAFLRADGSPYGPGERLVQPELARTLRAIATEGPQTFYTGEIGRRMTADFAANGGFVTARDLADYAAVPAQVVRGSYRGHDLVGTYLPASGATTIQIMQMLETFDLPAMAGSAEWIALLAQAIRIGFTDRAAELGTPEEKARTLTSKEWAAERARQIRRPGAESLAFAGAETWYPHTEAPHTTHLSVADARGGIVALTQSIGPSYGSHVATEGLGFLYASTQGYLGSEPGGRPSSSQSPLIVLRDGQPVYVLGAAGAARIISAIVAVLSRAIDEGLPFEEAMFAPRIHPVTHSEVHLEHRPGARWPESVHIDLRSFGMTNEVRLDPSYFGRVHGIAYDVATGEFVGVADPRRDGSAEGPRR